MRELFVLVVGTDVYLSTEIVEITKVAVEKQRLGETMTAGFVPFDVPLQTYNLNK